MRDTLTGIIALAGPSAVGAENGAWTVLLDPMDMDAFGHDQQVLSRRVSLGATTNTSIWSGVPVPPNVAPAAVGGGFNKNTIVFFGVGAAIRLSF